MATSSWMPADAVMAVGAGIHIIAGSFAPAGTGDVTDVKGKGFTVARTGVGTFRITLKAPYRALIAATHGKQRGSATDATLMFKTYDVTDSTTPYIDIVNVESAAAADIAASASNRINFVLFLATSELNA